MITSELSGASADTGATAPELIFAMTRAIGTDSAPLLSQDFRHIEFLASTLKDTPEHERYRTYMNAGDLLRSVTQRADAAGVLGIRRIREARKQLAASASGKERGRAYILKSLMHPGELDTLRRVYGPQLFVVSVFAPRDVRVKRLAAKIGDSCGDLAARRIPEAEELVNRDFGISPRKDDPVAQTVPRQFVIDVQRTFQKADLFISATAPGESREAVTRFMELIFGHPFHTPTREEFGMCMAHCAAARSAALGRGVGAAILTPEGDLVSVGTNEVPCFGGGQYWEADKPDGRTFVCGHDSSDRIRKHMFADLLRRLHQDRVWAEGHGTEEEISALHRVLDNLDLDSTVERILTSDVINKASVLDVIEYGREVHAEMAALTDAAKRGVPVRGCVLYCTTFPCHECARLIVSSGITRVVYIEPYPKSRVAELYEDSIGLADRSTDLGHRVRFEPFVGIAPRRYFDLFSWVPRKAADVRGGVQNYSGDVAGWSITSAALRDTVADGESLKSGARAKAIECGEIGNVTAFQSRLAEAEERGRQLESSSETP